MFIIILAIICMVGVFCCGVTFARDEDSDVMYILMGFTFATPVLLMLT